MRYGAFGLVEVLGEANAIIVADQMLKTSDVTYETQDTKCGGHVLLKVIERMEAPPEKEKRGHRRHEER